MAIAHEITTNNGRIKAAPILIVITIQEHLFMAGFKDVIARHKAQ
jgi:hypothetical protein